MAGKYTKQSWEILAGVGKATAWGVSFMQAAAQDAAAAEAMKPPDPMEGFARTDELARYRDRPGSFALGKIHEDHGASFEAGIQDDRGIFIMAGPRTGKGSTLIINNLLRWPGPVFCIDPKGENASITAMRRGRADSAKGSGTRVRPPAFHGQKVALLDPLGQTQGPARKYKVAYNPLADIDLEARNAVGFIEAVAEAIVPPETDTGAHFAANAQTILCGLIEAVLDQEPAAHHTLGFVEEVSDREWGDVSAYLAETKTPARLALKAKGLLEKVGPEEGGSFFTTVSKNLRWLADPAMREHLNGEPMRGIGSSEDGEPFSLRHAMQEGWSVYVVIPPLRMSKFRHWMRLIVNIALTAKDPDIYSHQGKQQTLFLLDEFPVLGHFQIIENSAGFLGSFGIKLVPVIQNIGQLKRDYDKNWETFMGTAGAIVAFGLNDAESEEYISRRVGRILVQEASAGGSSGFSAGGFQSGSSVNVGRHERPVRFPNEIHDQGARETLRAFVIPADGKPFMVRRVPYMELSGRNLFDDPASIAVWESQYGHRFRK